MFAERNLTEEQMLRIKNSPEYKACIGYDQNNPHHFLPLDLHMQRVADEVENQAPWDGWLYTAAMLHDIGKAAPGIMRVDKKRNNRYFGHAAESAKIARRLLLAVGYPEAATWIVCWYIQHHDDFISFKISEDEVPQNHPFYRLVTVQNVAEVILKTFLDVDSDKDIDANSVVRFLMTGKAPSWGRVVPYEFKPEGEIPPLNAFESLIILIRADASAQVGPEPKIAVADAVEKVIRDAYAMAKCVMDKNNK